MVKKVNITLFLISFVLTVGLVLTQLQEARASFPGDCESPIFDPPYNCLAYTERDHLLGTKVRYRQHKRPIYYVLRL